MSVEKIKDAIQAMVDEGVDSDWCYRMEHQMLTRFRKKEIENGVIKDRHFLTTSDLAKKYGTYAGNVPEIIKRHKVNSTTNVQ